MLLEKLISSPYQNCYLPCKIVVYVCLFISKTVTVLLIEPSFYIPLNRRKEFIIGSFIFE
jgi:hypothetical protein